MAFVFSSRTSHLEGLARTRYVDKSLSVANGDPYEASEGLRKEIGVDDLSWLTMADLPDFAYPDLYNYLVNDHSYYTGQQLKAYKSLDAYNQLTQGWITYFSIWKPNTDRDIFIVFSKVLHSQGISKPPLQPWIAINNSGTVECAHCTCMAGLGEVCTHIAATLFGLETIVRSVQDMACTSLPCYWLKMSSKPIHFAESSEMDFSRPSNCSKDPLLPKMARNVPLPTPQEISATQSKLKATGFRSAALSIMPGYSKDFVPKIIGLDLPEPLPQMFSTVSTKLNFTELVEKCESALMEMKLTKTQVDNVEEHTREQRHSKLWYIQRAGRITASNFKKSCNTDPMKPSVSLIKNICYPECNKFSSNAVR